MSDTKELEHILGLCTCAAKDYTCWYQKNWQETMSKHSYDFDSAETDFDNRQLAAIQSAIAECIGEDEPPELYTVTSSTGVDYQEDGNQQRNQLRAEIRANLKAKGLLR